MSSIIEIEKYGSSSVLTYKTHSFEAPKVGEVQIKNSAIGVNYHDVYVRSGLYKTLKLPGTPGCEASGIIEKIGKNVDGFEEGDRVTYLTREYGAYATHINIEAEKVLKLPATLRDELVATNFLRAMISF